MSVADHVSSELVELAEASLALGDADAAIQLLAQVDEEHRDNHWISTQVEALRLTGEFEQCRKLAMISLGPMIEHRDWESGRRVLIACARAFDDLLLGQELIKYLHDIEVQLCNIKDPDLLFSIQLLAMLASRIGWEGDIKTSSAILDLFASRVEDVSDRRAKASILWVEAELAEMIGDFELAFSLMESVIPLFQEENDSEAALRAISHLGWLVTANSDFQLSLVQKAQVFITAALQQNYGESSMIFLWLHIHLIRINCLLGNTDEAMELLVALPDIGSVPDEVKVCVQISWAQYNIMLGNLGQGKLHLDNARMILQLNFNVEGDEEMMGLMRQLAHLYADIGELATALELLDCSTSPQADFSRYLPSLRL